MIDQTSVYDYGLIVPAGTDVDNLAPEVQQIIAQFKAEFPASKVYGTVVTNNQQVIYVRMQVKLTEIELNDLFIQHNLAWEVIGIRSAYKIVEVDKGQDEHGNQLIELDYDTVLPVNKDAILPFVPNATLESTLIVPVYAGTDPIIL